MTTQSNTIKIFVSMPMRGKTPAEIEYARSWQHTAAKELVSRTFNVPIEDCIILDTFIKNDVPENANPLWYMGEGIRTYLSQADILVLAPDWKTARGCIAEKFVAESYDVPTLVLDAIGKDD
jgi:hypothetical protein